MYGGIPDDILARARETLRPHVIGVQELKYGKTSQAVWLERHHGAIRQARIKEESGLCYIVQQKVTDGFDSWFFLCAIPKKPRLRRGELMPKWTVEVDLPVTEEANGESSEKTEK